MTFEEFAGPGEAGSRLEHIVNSAPILFLITVGSVVVEINENTKIATGLGIGDNALLFYADPSQRERLIRRAYDEGAIKNEVVRINFADGTIHRCMLSISASDYKGQRALVVWAVDIEQTEAQKDELALTRENMQQILDMMPVAVRISDPETKVVMYANRVAADLFLLKRPEDAYGMPINRFLPETQPDGKDSIELAEGYRTAREPTYTSIVMQKADGTPFEALVISSIIDYNGREASLGIIQDLTSAMEQQRMLSRTAEREREANLMKSRFLVNMSHEIRTPMNAIIGLTEIELQKNLPRETREIYKKISFSAKNLLDIINDILDLSKIEADKIELYNEEFELEEVLQSALLVAAPRLDGKNVELLLNASMDLPRYLIGDKTRLWQVLKNFLDNSAKFTDTGKIVLTVFEESGDDETIMLAFYIMDTGVGIDEEQVQRIFMPYEQIYNDAQKRYSGTGLGMVISKQLCELMGGTLKLESSAGLGTVIHLQIPFRRADNRELLREAVSGGPLEGLHVLAVDDDRLSLDIIEGLITAAGARFNSARSGLEAMEVVLKHSEKGQGFDLVLLDYRMEDLSGLDTARQIHLALSKVPKLVIVSAYKKLLDKGELERSGICEALEKPLIPTEFIARLRDIMTPGDSVGPQPEALVKYKDVTVLLCEDYVLNQEVASGMLAQLGIKTVIAENGKQALRLLGGGTRFDLIFMDLKMPVMDGYEATKAIRADSRYDDIPIISLTADAMTEVAERCLQIGMNDHIAKPIEFSTLSRVFERWLPEEKRITSQLTKPVRSAVNEALARFGGDRGRYEKSLLEFAGLIPDVWPDFNLVIEYKSEFEDEIHRLKGAAGNMSEDDVYRCASELETALRRGEPAEALYNRLAAIGAAVKARILGRVKVPDVAPVREGSREELCHLLRALYGAAEEYDPRESVAIAERLMEKSWPGIEESVLRELCGFVQKYEFDSALEMLGGLAEALYE